MIRSGIILLVYVTFLVVGWSGMPFVASLGYVWVDSFSPQSVAWDVMNRFPVSLVIALSAVGSYLLFDRRYFRVSTVTILIVLFTCWITVSTFAWAVVPDRAYTKWDVAWKAVLFAAFLPLVFRSRMQIEAFLLTWVISVGIQILPFGVKTLLGGGGYGINLGVISGNSLLSEGSTLAAVALCQIPLLFHFYRHSIIAPRSRLLRCGFFLYAAVCVAASVGTYERTALVCMAIVAAGMWWKSTSKISFGVVCVLAGLVVAQMSGAAWTSRISTTSDYTGESSALGRILAWEWTLDYVGEHPLGGGFDVYRINRIVYPPDPVTGKVVTFDGKAFHSSWFEVLGEQGWPGLLMYVLILGLSLLQLQSVAKRCKGVPGLEWLRSLSYGLQVSMLTLLAGSSFVGIAFQPMIWYLVVASTATHNYLALSDRATLEAAVERRRAERLGFRPRMLPLAGAGGRRLRS